MTKLVKKRCDKCGATSMKSIAARACFKSERNSKGWLTGYRCPGVLRTVVAQKRKKEPAAPPIPKGLGLGHVLTEEYQAKLVEQRGNDGRAKAWKALGAARKKLKAWRAEQKRIGNLVKKWEKIERRLDNRSGWSDEDFEAERERAAKAAKVGHVKRRLSKSAAQEQQDGEE